jgi:hypothetical protein
MLASRRVLSPAPRIRRCRRRRGMQAQWHFECGGGPEGLVLRLVIAPVFERIFGDHGTREAEVRSALELPDPVLDVVEVDYSR